MADKYFSEVECASRDEIRAIQSRNLIRTVKRIYNNVPLYRARMDEIGLKPEDIHSVDDLRLLPFTHKQDLRDTYPYGLFACDKKELVRIHASSGTTGKQTVVGYTANDIDMWAECAARALVAAGADRDDFIHVSYGYGLFTGGLGLHNGAEKLGATAIPVSVGNTSRQIQIMQDFGSNVLCCTPSYALYLADAIKEAGIDPKTLPLRAGIFGAEPWTEEMRREIEKRLDIKAYDIYGLSEIAGPGVAYECKCQGGMHVNEDNFIIEIIDPITGEVLPEGSEGEIVFSAVTKEALPLIRYRTHDIGALIPGKCECGRTFVRMKKPNGRSDDMLIIRGVNVFPSQIESVLLSLGTVDPHYMIIVDRKNNLDMMEVQVEISDAMLTDKVKSLEEFGNTLNARMQSVLGISAKIVFVEPNSIKRSEGKACRVIDRRKA